MTILTKGNNINCNQCNYPLRLNSSVCPNCGKELNPKTINKKVIPPVRKSTKLLSINDKNSVLIKFLDNENKEFEYKDLLTLKINPKTIKILEIDDKIMVLRPLKVNDHLKNEDILIFNKKEFYNIIIEDNNK